jgi:hypothetical protein
MALKTARTSLYYIDPEFNSAGPGIVTVGCATSITGIGASRDQLEETCLEDTARRYQAGLGTPGTKQFTINFDPSDASHVRLYSLWKAGTVVKWALGLSDGPAAPASLVAPTYSDTADDFVLPTTRSFITYEGYVTDVPLDLALNAFVTANISVQVSDFPDLFPKTT